MTSGILLIADERTDSPALYYSVNVQGYIYHPGGKCKRIACGGMGVDCRSAQRAGEKCGRDRLAGQRFYLITFRKTSL